VSIQLAGSPHEDEKIAFSGGLHIAINDSGNNPEQRQQFRSCHQQAIKIMLNLGFITNAVHKLVSYFFQDYHGQRQSHWFKKALYAYVALKCIYWLCYFPLFFGRDSVVYFTPVDLGLFKSMAFLLYNLQVPAASAGCISLLLVICLAGLFYKLPFFIADLLLWFITLNLHNVIYPALSGGDHLLNQFLLFNSLLSADLTVKNNATGSLKLFFHNLSLLATQLQMALAYLLSALSKVNTAEWLNGDAISIVSRINHFSLFSFPGGQLPAWLFMFVTYFILVYQLAFPVVAWINRVKKPFLLIGIAMHVYIALVMGLPWFGTIMIIGYIPFWPFKESKLSSVDQGKG
jgi:hypothetical protein